MSKVTESTAAYAKTNASLVKFVPLVNAKFLVSKVKLIVLVLALTSKAIVQIVVNALKFARLVTFVPQANA